ncbi:FecR family protein [Bdellovibrio bacteriovorus]|uniref:FecR family protein n=1 Tax=Bdellovibrio bacteriovorus TaxID=959 RepID=UPI0021D13616|nr:FecR family protein [Bdellovibrio bacteriovorus]UXR64270.1 FecR family protein [Bdellovibrio bacteriovorus]
MKKQILIGCLLVITVLSFFVAKQFLFKAELSDENLGPTLAEVRNVKNELRYKHVSGFFWADAAQSQKLYNGSEVFTGSSSEAQIEMRNKDVVVVPEKTLLRITDSPEGGSLTLNLEQGQLQLEGRGTGKPLNLRVGSSDLTLNADAPFGLFVKKDASGEVALSLSSGQVTLEGDGIKKALTAGQAIELKPLTPEPAKTEPVAPGTGGGTTPLQGAEKNAGGSVAPKAAAPKLELSDVEQDKIVLLEPPSRKVIYGSHLEFFKWKQIPDKKVTLEYSRTADFLTESRQQDVTGMKEAVLPKDMGTGEYYWRLVVQDKGVPQFSETRSFRLESLKGNKISDPVLNFKERGKWQLNVPVEGAKTGEKFHLQVGRNKSFEDLFDEYEGPEPLRSFIDAAGEYRVRVRKSYGSSLYSDWSDEKKIFVRPPLTAPLLSKADEKLNDAGMIEMGLSWTPVPYAQDYLVQIGEGPKFTRVLKNVVVDKSPYVLKHNETVPGYMRVVARSPEGEYSPPSDVYQVKGLLRGPAIEKKEVLPPLFEKPGSTPQFHLLWTHREAAKKYRVELSRDPKLANSQTMETENVEFFHSVNDEGWYYFRVWPLGDNSKYFSVPTSILAVSYGKPGPLITPKLLTPKKNEVFLIPRGVPVSIKFSWTESPENEWYALEMAQNPNFTDATHIKVEAQEYVLKNPIKNGQWYFRVRGRNQYRASAWSETGVFYFGVSK